MTNVQEIINSARKAGVPEEAIQAALSNYLITFFGVPIAAIWLGERMGTASLIGGVLVLASTLLITLWMPGQEPATEGAACRESALSAERDNT